MAGLVGGTAWADAPGEIPSLSLSSNTPGELTISWNAPATTPEDYRVAWAKNDLSYLAWDASDETHRGSAYPSATATSHTLTGLTNGATYKVRMRSRYNTGTSEGWSGPWTTEATVTVTSPPPPPPPTPVPTVVPTAVPTAVPTVVPPSDEISNLSLSSDASGELTIRWNAPSNAPADYRVSWAKNDLSYLAWDADNETDRGSSYPDGADTSLTITGLTGGATYKVRMRSRYNPGTSEGTSGPWTGEVTQRAIGDAPVAPTGLSATETTSKNETSIALSWTAPSHDALTGYQIWRGADADSLTALVQDTGDTATDYNDTTTETGNTYVYAVTALSLDGDSPRSTTASVTRAETSVIVPRDPPPDDEEDDEELIALPQTTFETFVSNLGQTSTSGPYIGFQGTPTVRYQAAVSFMTGQSDYGFLINSIQVRAKRPLPDSALTVKPIAAIHADNSGVPGDVIYTLAVDSTFTSMTSLANYTIYAPPGATLSGSTKYWLQMSANANRYQTEQTVSDSEDAGAALGWSIGDQHREWRSNSPTWVQSVNSNTLLVAIVGQELAPTASGPTTIERADEDFPMTADTSGRLRVGSISIGTLDATDDDRSGDLLKIEGLTADNSYMVRAWFGTSKPDSATAERGGAIGLQAGRAGSPYISSFSPYNDNLLDDGRASFAFPVDAGEDYYVDVVAPAFRPPDGQSPAYTYYGPYSLEIYDLGPTQRLLGVSGQTCNTHNRICTGGTVIYSEGYGIKASNICVNYRCSNDPRFPKLHLSAYPINETHEVSVGNNPVSKNYQQLGVFRAGTTGPTAKFKVDRIGVFVHSMTSGSRPQAAVYVYVGGALGAKMFDMEPLYNGDGHIDYFVAPRDAQALTRNTRYYVMFTEGGGSSEYYKLYATAKHNEDDDRHPNWAIDNSGLTQDADLATPILESMRSGDTSGGTLVLPQFQIYAGVAP